MCQGFCNHTEQSDKSDTVSSVNRTVADDLLSHSHKTAHHLCDDNICVASLRYNDSWNHIEGGRVSHSHLVVRAGFTGREVNIGLNEYDNTLKTLKSVNVLTFKCSMYCLSARIDGDSPFPF